jgi:putative ABC transport system permease protein
MIKNFFTIAYRNILRNKSFSVINISGLAISMASAMLILLWVHNEMSYDNFYKNSSRLYQCWNRNKGNDGINCWNVTPKPLSAALKKDYPEVEQATRVFWDEAFLFTVSEKKMNVTGNMVDPEFLTMFQFPFIKGDMNTALSHPGDIVITQKLSRKLFGDEDAMGKTVKVDNKYFFTVSAVMKDLPNNTQFDFEYLLPWSHVKTTNQDDSCWGCNSTRNYVLLKPNTRIAALNAKIKYVVKNHTEPGVTVQTFLYPVSKLRLYANFENGIPSGGKIEMVRIFVLIAACILLIACINFMNMSTARSEKRAKEVGIRKVVGAQKKSLVAQFLGESILISCIAGLLALLTVQLCIPAFSNIINKGFVINSPVVNQLSIEYNDIYFWLFFIGFVLFTGIIAGIYPAFFLSSFKPVAVLKGSFKKVQALVTPRKVLVVSQFTFAIILIVATIIIQQQIKFTQERQTGYDKTNLVYVPLAGDIIKNYDLIKNDLLAKSIATGVSKTSAPITEGWSSGGAEWEGRNPNDKTEFNYYNSDGDIVKTAGLQLKQGRDLDLKIYPSDSSAVILNEAAVKVMGFKNPIGEIINKDDSRAVWHVIGVVKDFILQSPYEPVKPMIIRGTKSDWFNVIHIKLNNANPAAQNIAAMQKVFKQYNPEYPFDYYFVDEKYAAKFSSEQTIETLAMLFAGLTIFISCLGLFGLATYMAENRIKEIGVRKVLGASVTSITALLSKDFIKLVIVSIVIASPVAWYAMDKWLSGYNYRIGISPWIFLAAGLMAIFIALFTVSFQAIKAAIANPVKSLRTE